jgi:nucleotide-binding universal stress UspA family protein
MFRYRKILVALDGSALAERALPPALLLAEKMAASLTLLRVVTAPPASLELGLEEKLCRSRRAEAAAYLEAVGAKAQPAAVEITTAVLSGGAAKSIVHYAEAQRVDLIVLCSHGRSGLGRWVLGSVTSRVLRKAPCSVLVIRANAPVAVFSEKRLLAPLDGSPLAEQALPPALAIAQAVSAEVTLLSVLFSLGELAPALYQHHLDRITAEEQIDRVRYLARVSAAGKARGIPVTTAVAAGPAAERIISYAGRHAVDLIVMCSHGRSGAAHWAYGSVTEKVLQGAPCATLVVPGAGLG